MHCRPHNNFSSAVQSLLQLHDSFHVFELNRLLFLVTTVELVIISAGNKSDRTDRKVTKEQGQEFAQKNDMPFLEASANESNNIDELFLQLAKMLLESQIDKKPRSHEGGASIGSLVAKSHEGGASIGSLVARSHGGGVGLVPGSYTASVPGYSGGGKPPLTITLETASKVARETVNKQASGECSC